MKQLWAPWRLEYVAAADEQEGCIFCLADAGDDEEWLVVHRGERAFVLLNKFPYASGHLLVAPRRHIGDFARARGRARRSSCTGWPHRAWLRWPRRSRRRASTPAGTSGRIAGAGIVDHVHLHVVPRWAGDTNFMPVLADVRVLPEHLHETRRKLAAAWPRA